MYRSAVLYPGYDKDREYVYISRSVHERLSGLKRELRERHIAHKDLAAMIGTSIYVARSLIYQVVTPYLKYYLELARVMKWDISRDVNYAYANVIYPPREIERRLLRLFPSMPLNNACFWASVEMDWDYTLVRETVSYLPRRSSCCYGALMHWLQYREREKGYANALDFED